MIAITFAKTGRSIKNLESIATSRGGYPFPPLAGPALSPELAPLELAPPAFVSPAFVSPEAAPLGFAALGASPEGLVAGSAAGTAVGVVAVAGVVITAGVVSPGVCTAGVVVADAEPAAIGAGPAALGTDVVPVAEANSGATFEPGLPFWMPLRSEGTRLNSSHMPVSRMPSSA